MARRENAETCLFTLRGFVFNPGMKRIIIFLTTLIMTGLVTSTTAEDRDQPFHDARSQAVARGDPTRHRLAPARLG